MPTYVYGPLLGANEVRTCQVCAANFEMAQRMSDEPLSKCPQCGGAVQRIILAPNVGGRGLMGNRPSDNRLAQAGFTQYKRHGKGYYEKSFGQGPATLHGD